MTDLIGAPVPRGLYSESKHHAGPGQVSCDGVPKNVEGVMPRLVATLADVPRDGGNGLHVAFLETFIAAHFIEGCKADLLFRQTSNDIFQTASIWILRRKKRITEAHENE